VLFLLRPRQTRLSYSLPRSREQVEFHNAQLEQAYAATRRLPSTPPSATSDVVAELRDLARLRDAGRLTDDEFAVAQAKILDR
jgi:hypothetical protein